MAARRHARPAPIAFAMTFVVIVIALVGCHRDDTDAPFTCPAGATLMGAPPPKGQEVWCQEVVGGRPIKHGIFIAYGDNGKRTIEGFYRDGLQDGAWTIWYENGTRASLDHYRAGVHDGLHTSWYANGVKAIEGNYREGKRHGVWTQWDPTGLTSKQMTYQADRKID
jgi:MORN repeat variant